MLKYGKHDIIEISYNPDEIVVLPNGQIVISSLESLCLYNAEFILLSEINAINQQKFNITGLAANSDVLYISDSKNHKISMIDFNFSLIKSIGSYKLLNNDVKLKSLEGMCFKNQLFVCDYFNKRIFWIINCDTY